MFMSFGLFNSMFPVLFGLFFVIITGVFIFFFFCGIKTWIHNNRSPRLSVPARVAAKRTNVSHHHHHHAGVGNGVHMSTSTSYYATFEVESGDRMEFHLSGQEYGLLAEGDTGVLSFQGTRYLSFDRTLE